MKHGDDIAALLAEPENMRTISNATYSSGRLESAMVLVIGDIILDRYTRGEATRLAPEAPVPVVLMDEAKPEWRLGGAGNVAASIAALGEKVSLVGPYGRDGHRALRRLCGAAGIELLGEPQGDAVTTIKTRVVDSSGRLLIRLDSERRGDWAGTSYLRDILGAVRPDTVVFSDYDKGAWTFDNWRAITSYFELHASGGGPRRLVVDAKRRLEWYEGAGLVKCNKGEWDRFGGDSLCPIDSHAVVTKGKMGLSHGAPPGPGRAGLRRWDDIPATEHDVHDVTGAGDIVAAVIAAGLSRELPMRRILESAVEASSASVTRPMTGVADPTETNLPLGKGGA